MMDKKRTIAIVGAGASGLMAAISAAEEGAQVTVFEHNMIPGKKLSLTGNGRCNFTNEYMDPECFHLSPDDEFYSVIDRFGSMELINFFMSIGVQAYFNNGYLYPDTEDASTVVKALVDRCTELGVDFKFGYKDVNISYLMGEFDKVILATGSRAQKQTGSDGSGYKILEKIGVKYSRVLPALCAIYCDDDFFIEHAGERVLAKLTVIIDHIEVASDTGELQITDYGLSGIPAFQLSRYVSRALDMEKKVTIKVNFNPDEEDIPEFLMHRTFKRFLGLRYFEASKTAGFDKSQVCTGGVTAEEVDPYTLSLRRYPDVYVVGELLDVDGICGGYNLQWAFSTGYLAGKHAAN